MKLLLILVSLLFVTTSCKGKKNRKETNTTIKAISQKAFINSVGMEMIFLSDNYWVSAYETTISQYYKIIAPSKKLSSGEMNLPIFLISSNQAIKYCQLLTEYEQKQGTLPKGYIYSLPTEKMWRNYVADAKYKDSVFNNFTLITPSTVGTLTPNRLGLYDVRGNVYEWVLDWYKPGNSRWDRVILGGGFKDHSLEKYDIKNRSTMIAGSKSSDVGFRVVLRQGGAGFPRKDNRLGE